MSNPALLLLSPDGSRDASGLVTPTVSGATTVPGHLGDTAWDVQSGQTVSVPVSGHLSADVGSFAAWVAPGPSASSRQVLTAVGSGGLLLSAFVTAAGQFWFRWVVGGVNHTAQVPITLADDSWHFVYGEWDGADMAAAVDGGTLVGTTRAEPAVPLTLNLNVGSTSTGAGPLNGPAGPLMTFGRTLTSAEITRLYARTEPWSFYTLLNPISFVARPRSTVF